MRSKIVCKCKDPWTNHPGGFTWGPGVPDGREHWYWEEHDDAED